MSSETNNKTKTKGNMTCFRETFINNEANRNNDSDYTEATTNDHIASVHFFLITSLRLIVMSSFQLIVIAVGRKTVEISKITVSKLIVSNSDMMKK